MTQCQPVTDGHTDGRTDGFTLYILYSALHVCCRAVKIDMCGIAPNKFLAVAPMESAPMPCGHVNVSGTERTDLGLDDLERVVSMPVFMEPATVGVQG